MGYNLNSAIMQSLGDSRTPLLLLAIACVLNVVLDLWFDTRSAGELRVLPEPFCTGDLLDLGYFFD